MPEKPEGTHFLQAHLSGKSTQARSYDKWMLQWSG